MCRSSLDICVVASGFEDCRAGAAHRTNPNCTPSGRVGESPAGCGPHGGNAGGGKTANAIEPVSRVAGESSRKNAGRPGSSGGISNGGSSDGERGAAGILEQ